MKKLSVFLFVICGLLFPVSGSAQTPYINGNNRNGNETFDGNLMATAWQNSHSCRPMEAVRCVDSANTAQWAGKDIGAWVNAAYADLPTPEATKAAAGVIYVFPKPDGSCYTDSTQILLNTNGKPAIVDFLGSCIDTSAAELTTAVVLDWGQAPGITGRFENLHLKGPCTTTTCSGVTANGISLGPTNGLVGTILSNIYIGIAGNASGYLNGMLISSPGTYIDQCQNCFVYGSNIGVNILGGAEGFKFIGGSISQNAVGVQTASNGAGIQWISTSFDDNRTYAFHRLSSTTFDTTCVECHFENSGLGALQVLQDDNSSGRAKFIGGDVLDDRTTSTNAVLFVGGQNLYAEGVTVFSSGITITQVATLSSGGNGTFGFINAAPSAIHVITTNTTARFWDRSVPSSSATMNVMRKNFIADSYLENSNAPVVQMGKIVATVTRRHTPLSAVITMDFS